MDGGGAGARQTGHEDRPLDRDVDVLRVLLEGRLGDQPGHQRVADEEPLHLAAELGEVGVVAERIQQHAKRFAVVVIVDAEIIQTTGFYRRCVQVIDGTWVGASSHG